MNLSIKEGVRIERLHIAMVEALPIMVQVYASHGYELTITEGNDTINRQHPSLHKANPLRALDLRTWQAPGVQMDDGVKASLALELRENLGPKYDVIWGPVNIHVEFDP
jgi:hypothetical protein